MATLDVKLLDVLGKIEEHLRNNNGGNSSSKGGYRSRPKKFSSRKEFNDYLANLQSDLDKEDYFDSASEREKINLKRELLAQQQEELKNLLAKKRLREEEKNKIIELTESIHKLEKETNTKEKIAATGKDLDNIVKKITNIYNTVKSINDPWAKADDAASKFTKTLGGTKAAMDRIRKDTLDSVATGIGIKFNMSTEELLKAQQDYLKGIGRNISIDDSARESMAAIARISADAGVDGLGMAAQFENFGISMEKTGDHMGKMFAQASKEGLSFQKYSDNVAKNIKIAQNYSFKDGVKGLESMAKKATAIKMDMQQIANFADKVSTVEGAIETSAKLQVLGGPFAAMANPMEMLNEGLNDIEGLGDRVSKMLGSLGHFDKQTGEVKVSSFDKRRLRAYAEATGQDYNSVMEQVHTQAKRGEIEKQIGSSAVASKFDKDMKELIMNTGVIKDGKVGVNVNGKFKTLDEIKEGDRETLKQQTQTESEDIKQIAMDLRSLVDLRSGAAKQKDAIQAEITSPLSRISKGLYKLLDYSLIAVTSLGTLVVLQQAAQVAGLFGGGGGSSFDFTDLFRRGGGRGVLGRGLGRAGKRGLIKAFGKNGASKILGGFGKKAATKAATTVTTRAASTAATKAAAQGLGKSILGNAAKGGGVGAVLGIGGAIGNYYTDKAVAEGKMEKGGTGHTLAKTGSQALVGAGIGAAIGSIIPGIGTAIGAAIGAVGGAVVGMVQAGKAKNEVIVDNQLKDLGIERKGDYNRKKLKKIDKALQTGELSDRMRRKLIQKGDIDIVKAIDKKKEEKEAKELKKKEIKAKNKMKFGTAIISVGVAKISGIGPGFGLPNAIGKGVKKLGQGTISLIKGVKEKGIQGVFEDIKSGKGLDGDKKENKTPNTFNINISGTLKLTGENGQSVDIIEELRKNPNMLRSLSDMIAKEIGYLNKGAYQE